MRSTTTAQCAYVHTHFECFVLGENRLNWHNAMNCGPSRGNIVARINRFAAIKTDRADHRTNIYCIFIKSSYGNIPNMRLEWVRLLSRPNYYYIYTPLAVAALRTMRKVYKIELKLCSWPRRRAARVCIVHDDDNNDDDERQWPRSNVQNVHAPVAGHVCSQLQPAAVSTSCLRFVSIE